MSNRDPLYGDSTQSNTWDTTHDTATSGNSDDKKDLKSQAQQKLDEASSKADDMAHQAEGAMNQGKQKADEMAGKAQHHADEGMDKAADAMDKGAQMLRERGREQGGTVGSVAGTAADAMESAGSYLHETNTSEMMDQVEAYIRQNPTQSLLIAAGVGFVLAKAFK
jgi:ElaB/YqjD/DUF883 family membrane-anchored ribosome-binding protein